MARKKVSTTIYLEQEQLDALQALSKETKVPMAEYIRQGVDHVLTTHARELAVATLHAAAEAAKARVTGHATPVTCAPVDEPE